MSTASSPVNSNFDLESFDRRDRGRAWSDFVRNNYYQCDVELSTSADTGFFNGTLASECLIANAAFDEVSVRRTHKHMSDSIDAYFILIPRSKVIMLEQRGYDISVPENEIAFYATTEPYFYRQGPHTRFDSILVPGQMIRTRKPNAHDFIGQSLSVSGAYKVFTDFVASLCRHASTLDKDALSRTHETLLDLLALVLERSDADSCETAVQAAHRRRIMQALEVHFRDADCGSPKLSKLLGLSPRYIQHIMTINDQSVSSFLRARRIREACRILSQRSQPYGNISAVAYAIGYTDPAYFSRVFKRSVGVSPSDYATSTQR